MKKILFALLLLPVFASAQRLQYVNNYGYQYQRLVIDSLFAPPSDTFTVPTALQGYPFIARKGTGLYLWNTSTHVWAAVSGSGSTPTWQQTLTAGSTLTVDNTITLGSNSLIFSGGAGSSIEAVTDQIAIETISSFTLESAGPISITGAGLTNLSTQDRLLGIRNSTGQIGNVTLGSGLSLSSGVLSFTPAGNYGNVQLNRNGAFATPASDSLSFSSAALNVKGAISMSDNQYLKIGGSNILHFNTGSNNATFAGAYNFLFNNGGNVFMNSANTTYFSTSTGDLYFSGSGKLGIGTASPTVALQVEGEMQVSSGSLASGFSNKAAEVGTGVSAMGDFLGVTNNTRLYVDDPNGQVIFRKTADDIKVGINTASPTVALDVVGAITTNETTNGVGISAGVTEWYIGDWNTAASATIHGDVSSGEIIYGATTKHILSTAVVQMDAYGAGAATFDASGNISSVSDVRLKNVQGGYSVGLSALMNIKPIVYKWNEKSKMETKHNYIGFSAQNILSALGQDATGINKDGYLSIQDRAIMATMVVAIQEQQKMIETLQKEIKKLKRK